MPNDHLQPTVSQSQTFIEPFYEKAEFINCSKLFIKSLLLQITPLNWRNNLLFKSIWF